MTFRSGRFLLIAAALLAPPSAIAASLKGAAPGRMLDAPDGQSRMEQLTIEPALAPALLGVPLEGSVRIEDWPVAPGVRRTVAVTRHDVYAPEAKIVIIDGGKEVEIPRSKLVFLWGTAEGDGATSVLITLDPDTAAVTGSSMTPEGAFDLLPPNAEQPRHLLAREGALRKTGAGSLTFECGFDQLPKDRSSIALDTEPEATLVPQVLSSLHSAVIAVETDNEFMSIKFGNNTTMAANYIAQVFAGITVFYERDLFVRLFQGYTILRLSTTPDPYLQVSGGNANGAELDEFENYWSANYTGVKRALAMMLSGKQPGTNLGSGIAEIAGLCSSSRGYSFTQVFPNITSAGTSDYSLIGHEIGHNFGAPHTHCTDTSVSAGMQPIDFCYSAECGSDWAPNPGTTSCPAPFTINPINGGAVTNVRGTLMSYCHVNSVCVPNTPANPAVTNVFHPLSISVAVGPHVDSKVNQCIFPVVANPAPTVTSIAPVSGLTTGGTAVTITGTNFRSPAGVALADLGAGQAATGVVVVNPTTITATTPAHTAGLKDVVVMNPDQQTGTLKNGYTYVAAVTVTAISPNGGSTAGGTAVTISGANFVAPATVTLGGTPATGVNVVSSTSITATTPAHAAGLVTVGVQSDAQSPSLPNGYLYLTPPPPAKFYTLAPCRLVDTRNAVTPNGLAGPALVASSARTFTLTNVCGVPTTAKSISVNLTVTSPAAPGFVSLFPGDGIAPATSNINFSPGQTRANNAVVLLATNGNGSIAVLNGAAGTVHFILDVNGYFQ